VTVYLGKSERTKLRKGEDGQVWWYMSVIPAAQEAKGGGTEV
jgi:hypothetical protein